MFELSERLKKLPPYLFAEIDEMKRKKEKEGVKVIDFGVGDPDIPTPKHIVDAMKKAVEKPEEAGAVAAGSAVPEGTAKETAPKAGSGKADKKEKKK